jgi:hypothetical protein
MDWTAMVHRNVEGGGDREAPSTGIAVSFIDIRPIGLGFLG